MQLPKGARCQPPDANISTAASTDHLLPLLLLLVLPLVLLLLLLLLFV